MKQENIKKVMEQIRSKKNNETNELVVAAEEASLNTTTKATMNVASARALTTTTISVSNYLYMDAYDIDGNALGTPFLGYYASHDYALMGSVNMSALLSENNINLSDLTGCNLTLYGSAGSYTDEYLIVDSNGDIIGTNYGGGSEIYVPLMDVYNSSGNWDFMIIPTERSTFIVMSGEGDLEVSYNVKSLTGISITTKPNKKKYLVGDKFNPLGMIVKATYSNGSTKTVTDYNYTTSVLTAETTSITISYTENGITKTATQAITVSEPGNEGYFGNKNIGYSNYGKNPIFNIPTMSMIYYQQGLSIGINDYQIKVNLVYHSQMKDRLKDMCKGMFDGWKLDAHQFVIKDGKDDNNVDTYKYIDGSGYVYTFEFYDQTHAKYCDTDGLGLILVKTTSGYEIYDENNNVIKFDASGRMYQTVSGVTGSVKVYVYEGDYLKRMYDSRNTTRKIEFTYSSNKLTAITSYDNGVQKEKLSFVCNGDNNLTSISKKPVSGNATTINKFSYDVFKKLSRIEDVRTTDAIQITNNFNTVLNDYVVYQMDYGYMHGSSFVQKSYVNFGTWNVQTSDYKTLREVQCFTSKGVKTSFMLNSKGRVVNTFECVQNTHYKSLSLQAGRDLAVGGSSTAELINSYGKVSLVSGAMEFSKIVESTELDACKHLALKFRLKLKSITQRAYANIIVTTDTSSIISKKTMMDASAYESWQDVYIPFTRGTERITQFRVTLVDHTGAALEAEVCNFYLVKQDKAALYLNNGNQLIDFKDITKVKFYSSPNILTEEVNITTDEKWYMTENDVLRTLRKINAPKAEPYTNFEVYFNNGTKRKTGKFALKLETSDGRACYLVGTQVATCYTETVSADGKTTTRTDYAFNSSRMTLTNKITAEEKESVTTKVVDYYGRTQSETDVYGVVTTYEYHVDGSLKKQTIASGNQSMVVYENTQSASADDKYDILTDKSFNLGEKYTYHNLFGTLDKVERLCYNDSTGTVYNSTNYEYDSYYEQLLKVSSTVDNQTHTNTLTYADGMLSEVTDGKVNYQFTYDKATDTATFNVEDGSDWKKLEEIETEHEGNDVTQKYYRNDASTPTDTFVYTTDKYGKPISETCTTIEKDANGNDITTTYTVAYNYTEGSESQAAWVLASVNDQFCGRTYSYEYNADGSQKSVGFNGFKVTKVNESEKEYEIGSYNIKQTIGQGENTKQIVNLVNDTALPVFSKTYTYDNFGRLDKETNAEDDTIYTYGYETGKYNAPNYLRYGKLKIEDNILLTTTTYHNLVREEKLTYDERGNIHTIVESGDANRYIRTMVVMGGLVERTESDDYYENSKTYTYDALGRIKTEVNTLLGINRSYTYNNNGRISDFGDTSCVYDNRGRLTGFGSTTLTYDNYGNRLTKGSTNYTWTRGRLLASVGNTTFEYDYKGRRTKKGTTEYYYDGDKLIAEVRSNNTLYYFYDAKGVCGFRYNGKDYEYIKNLFGDIVGIAQGVTLVARYEYDIWGNCTVAYDPEGIGTINPFRYRGYYFDTESGLYYLMSRYYDPEIGQFISPDTPDYLAPDTIGGVDLYAYCGNNPVMYVDSTGHFAIATAVAIGFWIGFGVGALAGATAGGIIAYEYCMENDISGWGMAGLMTLGILGGGYIGGAIGGAIGSAIGYGVGIAFGGTQALVEGASIALYSGGGSRAAFDAAVASGKMLIRETFAAKTLTFAQTIYPILKFKPIYNTLWGKLSYDFALGASFAEIYLNGSGIYEKSAFYCYEIWALLQRGIERIIYYV